MTLMTRFTRLFKADIHAVLDSIEEPDLLLRQSIREMEEVVFQDQQTLKTLGLKREQLEKRLSDLDRSAQEIAQQLDLCLDSNNDVLARTLLRRKLEAKGFQKHLTGRLNDTCDTIERTRARIKEHQPQLDSMQQKLEMLAQQNTLDPIGDGYAVSDYSCNFSIREEDIEVALLQEKQRRKPS